MIPTKENIATNASLLCGAGVINSFTEGTTESTLAAAMYDRTANATLVERRWSFTVFQKQASQIAGTPNSKWSKAYTLPANMLKIHRVDPEFIKYELYSDTRILTDFDGVLFIDGQFRVDEEDWPDYFIEYLEARLAQKWVIPLTEDESKAKMIENLVVSLGRKARTADAQQRKGVGVTGFPITDARG